jgi:serine/threonine-protein kinase
MAPPDPERWKVVEDLFFGALDQAPPDRLPWLKERCGNDSVLLSQVEAMLVADETAAGKLDGAVKAAADAAGQTQTAPPATSQVGRRLGPYTLVREIGRGASSTWYEAGRADGQHRRPVTIKMLAKGVEDQSLVRKFRAERQLLARFDHPAIIRLLDSGTTDEGRPYLITDYVDGMPVTRYCRETAINEAGKVAIFLAVCEAVQHVHEQKVLLRGLKPASILVSPEGKAKLVDFSSAWWEAAAEPAMSGGPFALDYTSPEVLRGEPGTVRSDVYSLGAIFYEMLTGRKALDEPRDASPLARIAAKAVRRDPARRYASMNEFAAAVRRCSVPQPDRLNWKHAGALALAAAAVVAALATWANQPPAAGAVEAIAVLPFINLGAGPNEDAISEGLTEDIITALARTRRLKVPSRSSVWKYKDRAVDTREAGRSLGVAAVLEGSVRRAGDQVRISAQLTGVPDGFHLWAGSFERKADRPLEMQRDVAGLVAQDLVRHVAEAGRSHPRGRAVPGSQAQRAYLDAYSQFNREAIRTEWPSSGAAESLQATIAALGRATQLDPEFSAGWAALSEATEFAATLDSRNRKAYRDQAEAAARKALELEPTNALALSTLGNVYMNHDWNLGKAEPYFRRAVEASPHSTGIHADYANLLASLGRYPEAVELMQRSALLEPGSARPAGKLAVLAAIRGDSAAARQYANASLALDKRYRHSLCALGRADEIDGELALAERRYRETLALYPTEDRTLASLGHLMARAGRREEAADIARKLHTMVAQGRRRETFEAWVRAGLGETDAALGLLEQAWQNRDANVLNLEMEARFRPLAAEPRFQALLRQLHEIR